MSMETRAISSTVINGIMHESRDIVDNSSASGYNISSQRAHMPHHGINYPTSINYTISSRRRVQYAHLGNTI